MARVSLILPLAPGMMAVVERIDAYREALEQEGHGVEVVEIAGIGMAVAAVDGLRAATGDLLLVVDPHRGYETSDLLRVVEPLIEGDAEIVVGTQAATGLGRLGALVKPIVGSAAPLSGLVGLTRKAARDADAGYAPVGSRFALELLVRTRGRRVDRPVATTPRDRGDRLTLDDLRHFKRLADDRFGNLSRLIQFCGVGASGMVIDLTCYALFQLVFSRTGLSRLRAPLVGGPLDLAVAGGLAIAVALVWNFSLNRRLTFNYARKDSIARQFVTYVLGNALGVALSFSLRLVLPVRIGFFHRHRLAAAFVGIVAATGVSFSMSRWVVFSRRAISRPHTRRSSDEILTEPSASC